MSIVEKAMRKRRGRGPEAPPDGTADDGEAPNPVERAMQRFREAAGVDASDDVLEAAALDPAREEDAPAPVAKEADAPDVSADGAGEPATLEARSNTGSAPAAGDAPSTVSPPAAPPPATGPDVVVELDSERLRAAGLLPADAETRRVEDQFRRIKRPLLAHAFGINTEALPNGNLIMVASSLPGEGKSFTSFNLATSIANEFDRTVLLVDADVLKPHISRSLGLHERRGLIDLLLDPALDLTQVILKTSLPDMRVLPAGPLHRHATELLASKRMASLLRELATRYPDRVIVFDTPPLIPTTEAQAMAHLMGQTVLVVNSAHTPQTAVLQAVESLQGSTSISLVLNKTRGTWGEEYGSYDSYYY